eukprot:Skav217082  [mRNA]  locus=scaffold1308:100497:105716:- [translate_table: standard]
MLAPYEREIDKLSSWGFGAGVTSGRHSWNKLGCCRGTSSRMGDEEISDAVGAAAHCEEPSIAAFADRIYGNPRIAQKIRHSPALQRAVLHLDNQDSVIAFQTLVSLHLWCRFIRFLFESVVLSPRPEPDPSKPKVDLEQLHFGSIEVDEAVTLIEKPESRTPKRTRIHVMIDRAEKLAGTQDRCVVLKIANSRFLDFIRKSQREKAFLQACRLQALDKQQIVKVLITDLLHRWSIEEQNELLRKGILNEKAAVEETVDPSKFRDVDLTYVVKRSMETVTLHLAFQEVRTSVLADSGGDPIWDCEGGVAACRAVTYSSRKDRWSADSLLATGDKRKRAKKQAMFLDEKRSKSKCS